ncbi:Dyslexia susceptibility 1 candidate gene 1 protein-like protein [Trichoplax sp. H2]|nr:Dyslexia susceptibility 1 candidate gene 1 protein-like protein [Trichoplax sp. H2]|eukprot:RDD46300.1 Dyslexia susceptibility 1 candidate gene 1 protein-like protein [Trichoplax sp. H2]
MPILVKDYTWKESETAVIITVPLKGVKANKVDVFSTDQYIKAPYTKEKINLHLLSYAYSPLLKPSYLQFEIIFQQVSYPPYLFEIYLLAPINEEVSGCKVGDGAVVFTLEKLEHIVWGKLTDVNENDKEAWKELRQHAVEKAHEKVTKDEEEKAKKKREEHQMAIKRQIELESEEKKRVEQVKEAERQRTTEEIEYWKETDTYHSKQARNGKNSIFEDKDKIPLPRSSGSIQVKFTSRTFPTAARESKAQEEQEWLDKIAAARRPKGDGSENPEESDPMWLKDKGSSLFKAGDYVSAINAFNEAIRLEPILPSLYLNRSACFLKIGDYPYCIEDCCKALERLTPPVPANAAQRSKAYVRRGTAYFKLELYVDALQDYDQAISLDPDNEGLKQDADMIRKIIQGSNPSDEDTVE